MARVIAIDGPSGAGKSTISKLLAERIGFAYLDTGALYRAVALWLTTKGLTPHSDDDEMERALRGVAVAFSNSSVYVHGRDVSDDIRLPEIGHAASVFSARRVVRAYLLDIQRNMANDSDLVAEGRDMTTVVFPDAWKKFYLDASEATRARRRYLQLLERQQAITIEDALRDVRERDLRDSTRLEAPLKRAVDAVYVDTTDMSLEAAIAHIMRKISPP